MIQQVTSRYPKILNTGTEISTCTQNLIAALFSIAQK